MSCGFRLDQVIRENPAGPRSEAGAPNINLTTIHIIDSFTALAHRSWILEEALPRKRSRLD